MFTLYFDVCFITSDKGVYITFILYIEAMAVKGGSGCIIKDSLIRDIGSRGVRAGMNKFILKSA